MPQNLTQLEQRAIDAPINLADGHPRQDLTPEQRSITDRLPAFLAEAQEEDFETLERRAQERFLDSLGQDNAPAAEGRVFSVYSSSVATMVVGRVLRERHSKVALVHPTFDNIPDLLRADLDLVPISEDELDAGDLSAVDEARASALWVTTPNNPTGWLLSRDAFAWLADEAARRGLLLCFDTSFRGFDLRAQYDMYEVLERAGTGYVVIEDTGKLWPVAELKLGLLSVSASLSTAVEHALSDVLLTVSPLVLALVDELARDAAAGGYAALHRLVADNRAETFAVVGATEVAEVVDDHDTRVSISRIRFDSADEADRARSALRARGVHVLPCNQFHWADPAQGASMIRIALARNRETIGEALARFESVVADLSRVHAFRR
jgi:aspartate/methionine/tyrosine aminotransferase